MERHYYFSKDDLPTREALRNLLPKERCHLDGRVPSDPVRLPCSHVYCRLCVQDIWATAALIGKKPQCKACLVDFETTPEPLILGTMGDEAKQLLESTGAPSMPSIPSSPGVMKLLREYTKQGIGEQPQPGSKSEPGIEGTEPNSQPRDDAWRDVFLDKQIEGYTQLEMDWRYDSLNDHRLLQAPQDNEPFDGMEFFDFESWAMAGPANLNDSQLQFDMLKLDPNDTGTANQPLFKEIATKERFQLPERDMSILAGERFCFKGALRDQPSMEGAVKANGGNVTGGGSKHTTYGVVGPGWKVTQSWVTNNVCVLSEDGFWNLLEQKRNERAVARASERGGLSR